jgi:hypothetical protein
MPPAQDPGQQPKPVTPPGLKIRPVQRASKGVRDWCVTCDNNPCTCPKPKSRS